LILDIGAGQGRNALYLARQGYQVHALEPSRVAVTSLEQIARSEQLPLDVYCAGFNDFNPSVKNYDGILVFGLIPDSPWAVIHQLIRKINQWSTKNTLLWITGFTTKDPAWSHQKKMWKGLGTNSFQSPDGLVRTYLEPDQIIELFDTFSIVHHWEGLGPEHRHGSAPPERHGKFECVLLKKCE